MPKLKKADRTRGALLDAALRVIGRKGFAAATVEEIVREAGVSKGVAYYHFKSKEQMAESILDLEFSAVADQFEEIAESEGSPSEVLLGMLGAFSTRLYERHELAQLFATEIWRSGRAWSEGVRSAGQGLIDLIALQLTRGQDEGTVRSDLDPTFAAASIVGMVVADAVYCLGEEGPARLSREQFTERIHDFVHHAVALR